MTYLSAKYVSLNGSVNIAGMQTKNLDAVRDGCEIYLHQETGGVFVVRGSDATFVSAVTVAAVDLSEPLRAPKEAKPNAEPRQRFDTQHVTTGAKNLADEVLSELRSSSAVHPSETGAPKSRRKRG